MLKRHIPYANYGHTGGNDVYSSVLKPEDRVSPNRPEKPIGYFYRLLGKKANPHYRVGADKSALLNHCSLPYVDRQTHSAIERAADELHSESYETRQGIADDIRKQAAALVGGTDPRGVIFAENVTTVNSIVIALLGGMEDGENAPTVILDNGANLSSVMAAQWVGDHSNQFQKLEIPATYDPWRKERFQPSESILVTLSEQYLNVFATSKEDILRQIEEIVPAQGPCIVQINHVLKQNGRILPVHEMIAAIKKRNPQAKVLIDGAQAVGNLPRVQAEGDGYLYPAHKALRGRPLGIAYVPNIDDPEIQRRLTTFAEDMRDVMRVYPETFHKDLNVGSNSGRVDFPLENAVGLTVSLDRLRKKNYLKGDDDFTGLDKRREKLRKNCKKRLEKMDLDIDIVEAEIDEQSNFILSFRIKDNPRKRLADADVGREHLNIGANAWRATRNAFSPWRALDIQWEHLVMMYMKKFNVEMSYLAPRKLFRVSFSEETKESELDHFTASLETTMAMVDNVMERYLPGSLFFRAYCRGSQLWKNHIRNIALSIPFGRFPR